MRAATARRADKLPDSAYLDVPSYHPSTRLYQTPLSNNSERLQCCVFVRVLSRPHYRSLCLRLYALESN